MDSKYFQLLMEALQSASVLAEQVMDYTKEKGELTGYKTSLQMRDDYNALYDKMRTEGFKTQNLTKVDFAKLFLACYVVMENLKTKVQMFQTVIEGYESILPKLEQITKQDSNEAAHQMAEEILKISETNN